MTVVGIQRLHLHNSHDSGYRLQVTVAAINFRFRDLAKFTFSFAKIQRNSAEHEKLHQNSQPNFNKKCYFTVRNFAKFKIISYKFSVSLILKMLLRKRPYSKVDDFNRKGFTNLNLNAKCDYIVLVDKT